MRYDAAAPDWPDRDRFVLSSGHASMLLYSMLYLTGFGLDARRPPSSSASGARGRPVTPSTATPRASRSRPGRSVRASPTGWASALAEANLRARFGPEVIDHHVFVDLLRRRPRGGREPRGRVARRAPRSRPPRLRLRRQPHHHRRSHRARLQRRRPEAVRGATGGTSSSSARSANDLDAIEAGIREGMAEADRPSLVDAAQPHRLAVAEVHRHRGRARQPARRRRGRARSRRSSGSRPTRLLGARRRARATTARPARAAARAAKRGSSARRVPRRASRRCADEYDACLDQRGLPGLGGEAPARGRRASRSRPAHASRQGARRDRRRRARARRRWRRPHREHRHASSKGARGDRHARVRRSPAPLRHPRARHGRDHERHGRERHCCPSGGTFFVFSDYMRPAVRLAALSQYKIAFVWSHDSIGVGEDGPTHQPIEHLASLRAMPGSARDPPGRRQRGRAQAWRVHIDGDGPTAIDPHPSEAAGARGHRRARRRRASRGARTCSSTRPGDDLDLVLVGTGSEVSLCVAAARAAGARRAVGAGRVDAVVGALRRAARRVPRRVLPPGVPDARGRGRRRRFGWDRYADDVVGIDRFGASAPGGTRARRVRLHRRATSPSARARAPARREPKEHPMTSAIARLNDFGQSPWYDNLARPLAHRRRARRRSSTTTASGASRRTRPSSRRRSAPATGYDEQLAACAAAGTVDRGHVLERRCVDDIRARRRRAAPGLRRARTVATASSRSRCRPTLAHDTAGTIARGAVALHARVDRPNVMIKIPATLEGPPRDRGDDRRGHQRERHADLLARAPRRR